ncbi:MAG TPA: glycoside hydrolase family 3 C-terminal domain-containing protein [Bacteroidota bacterium]|nr:glycoside hydrolase family 3 C-terminal domain-containing protein [Bacteroidota bacterium]
MRLIPCLSLALLLGFQITSAGDAVYKDPKAPTEVRINDLLPRLTLEEKLDLLGGTGFATKPIARLGIPELKMTDGPLGVRWGTSTAFPAGVMLASTWDTSLAGRYGWAVSQEALAKDRNVVLGPCVNINRVPQGGRDFESYGEDPFLASRVAVSYVKGLQSGHVAATVKHYATNNQEFERGTINNKVSLRAIYEIYLPAFKAAVEEGGALAIMSAYNKLNGAFCSENPFLLQEVLKKEWGFQGLVMSDWGAVHSTLATANSGLDLEMPTGEFLNKEKLLPLIKEGAVSESTIDDKVRRILRVMFKLGLFDPTDGPKPQPNAPAQRAVALDVARAGIVLLKNDSGLLPLKVSSLKTLAVIGPNAAVARTGGGGSSQVDPGPVESPLDALRRNLGPSVEVSYLMGVGLPGTVSPVNSELLAPPGGTGVHGLLAEYFNNEELKGKPVVTRIDPAVDFDWGFGSPAPGIGVDSFSVRWTGTLTPTESGLFEISTATDDGVRLYINGKLVIDDWGIHAVEARSVECQMEAGKAYEIRMEYFEHTAGAVARLGLVSPTDNKLQSVIALARKSDAVILFVGDSNVQESEGFDRQSIELPAAQERLIKAVTSANPRTVVVLEAGAQVVMENWIDSVHALLDAWYPGQEGAQALCEVLTGAVNPSGRLPVTMPKRWEDCSAYGSYPGANGETEYSDGIFVGYRHFDSKNIAVRYPFGYGLSYTTFSLSDLKVVPVSADRSEGCDVEVSVENTGNVSGAEVVEVYVHDGTSKVSRPTKELKGFAKVFLNPKEKRNVTFHLDKSAFSYYDDGQRSWALSGGPYEIEVGTSSRDIPLTAPVTLK